MAAACASTARANGNARKSDQRVLRACFVSADPCLQNRIVVVLCGRSNGDTQPSRDRERRGQCNRNDFCGQHCRPQRGCHFLAKCYGLRQSLHTFRQLGQNTNFTHKKKKTLLYIFSVSNHHCYQDMKKKNQGQTDRIPGQTG